MPLSGAYLQKPYRLAPRNLVHTYTCAFCYLLLLFKEKSGYNIDMTVINEHVERGYVSCVYFFLVEPSAPADDSNSLLSDNQASN